MRRYDETIQVRSGRIGAGIAGLDADHDTAWPEGPAQFVWRERLWRVLGVQGRWIESGAWWNGPAVRAARGEDIATRQPDAGSRTGAHGSPVPASTAQVDEDDILCGDLLCEQEIWRIEAANGREGSRGVYELAHAWADGTWRLRAVLD